MENQKFKFYEINMEYLKYLRKYEKKIMDISKGKEKRPHIGVVLKISQYYYLVPLTSPKEKHLKMKNNLDFLKIDGGLLGAVNFNNMFPVIEGYFNEKEIESEDDINYKILLRKQISWCNENKNREKIYKNAEKLYNEILNKKEKSIFWERCCNFILLEEKALEFKNFAEE